MDAQFSSFFRLALTYFLKTRTEFLSFTCVVYFFSGINVAIVYSIVAWKDILKLSFFTFW